MKEPGTEREEEARYKNRKEARETRQEGKANKDNLLLARSLETARYDRSGGCWLPVARGNYSAVAWQRFPRTRYPRRRLSMKVGVGLGGQIALVHALGAVLARRATIIVDTLRLALATAHAGTAGSQRCATGNRRHGDQDNSRMQYDSIQGTTVKRGPRREEVRWCVVEKLWENRRKGTEESGGRRWWFGDAVG